MGVVVWEFGALCCFWGIGGRVEWEEVGLGRFGFAGWMDAGVGERMVRLWSKGPRHASGRRDEWGVEDSADETRLLPTSVQPCVSMRWKEQVPVAKGGGGVSADGIGGIKGAEEGADVGIGTVSVFEEGPIAAAG